MKKQLLTVGDSWTYGDELTDLYQAWPYKLADTIGYEVHNMGLSGSSNTSIVRRTLEELSTNYYDLVIIGWSLPGRIEWKDQTGIAYNVWPGRQLGQDFMNQTAWRADLVEYVSQYHCSDYLYQRYLIDVLLLQSYFESRNIEYRMIDVMHKNYYRAVGAEPHAELAAQVNAHKFIGWRVAGMSEITSKYPKGPGGHPLELGHLRIAEKINEHIRN